MQKNHLTKSRQLVGTLRMFLSCFMSAHYSSDSEDFQAAVVADSDPVRLGGSPLDIIDLSLGCVDQYGVIRYTEDKEMRFQSIYLI